VAQEEGDRMREEAAEVNKDRPSTAEEEQQMRRDLVARQVAAAAAKQAVDGVVRNLISRLEQEEQKYRERYVLRRRCSLRVRMRVMPA